MTNVLTCTSGLSQNDPQKGVEMSGEHKDWYQRLLKLVNKSSFNNRKALLMSTLPISGAVWL